MLFFLVRNHMDRVKRIWYLSPMRAAKVQASLRIRAVSPEPSLLAHTSSESRGTFRQKTRSLAPLNGWTCAVEICHNGMLEDTNSIDGAHIMTNYEWPRASNKIITTPISFDSSHNYCFLLVDTGKCVEPVFSFSYVQRINKYWTQIHMLICPYSDF